jgi:hypothetical protein
MPALIIKYGHTHTGVEARECIRDDLDMIVRSALATTAPLYGTDNYA